MKESKYTDEFKLQVINDYLTGELGCRAIAKKYNLPSKNYITRWKKELEEKGLIKNTQKVKTHKSGATKNITKGKTAYEKQLEKENLELRATLAYFKELERIIEEDKKKEQS